MPLFSPQIPLPLEPRRPDRFEDFVEGRIACSSFVPVGSWYYLRCFAAARLGRDDLIALLNDYFA